LATTASTCHSITLTQRQLITATLTHLNKCLCHSLDTHGYRKCKGFNKPGPLKTRGLKAVITVYFITIM